jgi:hypothetical protein
MSRLDLPALDGANPLGFLAALGTLAVLTEADHSLKLGWQAGARWTPFLQSDGPLDQPSVTSRLVTGLRGQVVAQDAENKRKSAQGQLDQAKKKLKEAIDDLKQRKLRGKERDEEWEAKVKPMEQALTEARSKWLAALKDAVPSPELALGRRPDCTIPEFREHASSMLEAATRNIRGAVDMLAAFGGEISSDSDDRIHPTPFCFITGSGHQWFLDTARQLMAEVSRAKEAKVREGLFEPWAYRDEKWTMRWDPLDDRRYALMDRDPTAADNKSATVWMANLLAYRALGLFPCAPCGNRLVQACWSGEKQPEAFSWPIWDRPLGIETIRSLLCHPAFGQQDPAPWRVELRAMGVRAVYRSHRIAVGSGGNQKINFTPSTALF